MTGYLVVPTLTALTAENQPFEQFWAASCESWASGYGGAYAEARRICAQASGDAARRQVELMASEDERVALMATEAVLNRGAGKPRDHSAEERRDVQADLSALSHDERTTLARLLATALGVEKKR